MILKKILITIFVFLILKASIGNAEENIALTDLHVFLEGYATNPAFTQMIEYAQLPRQIPKIIAWHRFPRRANIINLDAYNTREIDLPSGEGYWHQVTNLVLKAAQEELEKHPEYNLILHANLWKMNVVLRPFLENIPQKRIKMIHLYEDGYGELFKFLFSEKNLVAYTDSELREGLKNPTKWKQNMIFDLSRNYPITYHFFGWSYIQKNNDFKTLKNFLKDLNISDVNFKRLSYILTEEQKHLIYKLTGFDYDYYKNLMNGKKSFVFLMGYHFDNKINEAYERNLLKRILTDSSFSGIYDPENWVWMYKPHPSYRAQGSILPMKKMFPEMIGINPQIPFEVFILAGLKPTYTAGFSSSAFYSLNKDDILFIIRRHQNDAYMAFLKKITNIEDKKVLDLGYY